MPKIYHRGLNNQKWLGSMLQCSLVVPVFNEEAQLEKFCHELIQFREEFHEVIFVDAGSTDATISILKNFQEKLNANIIELEHSLPGKGRNIGVENSKTDHIAFIDVGVTPQENWLKNLIVHFEKSDLPFAWGSCRFEGKSFWAKILAALSVGQGKVHDYVIPASFFHKDVFSNVGFFDSTLRAGEDTLFRKSVFKRYGTEGVCREALVSYTSFPENLFQCLKKWFHYASHVAKGNVSIKQEIFYYLFLILQVLLFVKDQRLFFGFLGFYALTRGIIDPMRRSKSITWWSFNPLSFFVAPIFAYFLDMVKVFGFLKGRFFKGGV